MAAFLRRIVWTAAACLLLTTSLGAQDVSTYLSGPHYNLNIIGVDESKTATMTNSSRHSIFVGLGRKNATITTNIWLQPGFEFRVCDGNGFDAARDCSGVPFKPQGATFQLPCNTSLAYDRRQVARPKSRSVPIPFGPELSASPAARPAQ